MNKLNKNILSIVVIILIIIGVIFIGRDYLKNKSKDKNNKDEDIVNVDNHTYSTCSGTLTKNKILGATCKNSDENMDITYKMYTGKNSYFYIVDDGIIVASYNKSTTEYDYSLKNLELTFYDANGDYKWTTTYYKEYNLLKPVNGLVSTANKVDNMYYIMLNVTYEDESDIEHLLKYDLNGNLVDDVIIKKGTERFNLEYIGEYQGKYYYNNSSSTPSIVAVTKEKYNLLFEDYEEEFFPEYFVMNDKYIYGIEYIYNEHEGDYSTDDVIGTNLLKFDLDGNLLKHEKVLNKYHGVEELIATDNYIYTTYYSEEEDKYYIYKYNHDFDLISENIDYMKDIDSKYEIYNIYGKDNKLYFEFLYNENYYVKVTDENLETINIYKSINEDALDSGYLLYTSGYINDKYVQIYQEATIAVNEEEMLFAFYTPKKD